MNSEKISARISAIVAAGVELAVEFVVVLILVRILWSWTIPDLFPGAVAQGLVVASLSWWTSVKVAIFVAVLSTFARHPKAGKK